MAVLNFLAKAKAMMLRRLFLILPIMLGATVMAMAEDLRDRNGNLLGRIVQRSDGKLEGRDKNGNLKGTYDPRQNETRDKNGKGRLPEPRMK